MISLVQELAVSRSVFFKKLYSMTQISYMVGINDPRYFSKCFKQKMGMTPTEYRDKGMNKINSSKNT